MVEGVDPFAFNLSDKGCSMQLIPLCVGRASWKQMRLVMLCKQQHHPGGELKRHIHSVDEKWWVYQLTQRDPDLALSAYIGKFSTQ